jgi:hypothetical protein
VAALLPGDRLDEFKVPILGITATSSIRTASFWQSSKMDRWLTQACHRNERSPVCIDGRLVRAVIARPVFQEPIAGITPIDERSGCIGSRRGDRLHVDLRVR